jgi:hypothetical protein
MRVDEETPIQALDRTRPILPLTPGHPERRTHDDTRHGTPNLFAALDVATGEVIGRLHRRPRGSEFLSFLRAVEANVPDDSSTHKTQAVRNGLACPPRFHPHFTTSANHVSDSP